MDFRFTENLLKKLENLLCKHHIREAYYKGVLYSSLLYLWNEEVMNFQTSAHRQNEAKGGKEQDRKCCENLTVFSLLL
jgi:hypothetical protein